MTEQHDPARPDPVHVEAVAESVYNRTDMNPSFNQIARVLLTSTDPAVLAAVQDLLFRAGWLTEDCGFTPALHPRCRLVTEWREVDQ